jgi:hypothetical protein
MSPKKFLYAVSFIAALAISAVSVTLSAQSFRAHPADEITYIRYASFIKEQGIAAYPRMVETYARDPSNKVVAMSSPLKAGFIVPAAFFLRFFRDGFAGLAFLSLVSYVLFVFCAPFFLKKEYGFQVALLCASLMAFSPLAMAMSRRALTESLFLCVCLLALWAFTEYLRSGRKAAQLSCAFLLVWAMLIKETAALLAVSFLAYALYRALVLKKEVRAWGVLVACASPIAAAAVVTLTLGNPRHVLDIFTLNLFSKAAETNQYDAIFCSGPWYRPLIDFLILSPGVFILGTGYFFTYLTRNDREGGLMTLLVLLALIWLMALAPFTKNVRYALLLDLPLRLGAVLMLRDLFFGRPRNAPWLMTTACVIFLMATDYARFWSLFVDKGIYDPVTPLLLQAVRILP